MKTDLSVIIVSYKGWEKLTSCLDSLRSFRLENFSMEVIVVDNNSPGDKICEIEVKYPDFRFIINKINGGFGYGNNIGSRSARGEYLLFLNPDTIVDENEIFKMFDAARNNPSFKIVSCKQVSKNGRVTDDTRYFPALSNLTGLQRTIAKAIGIAPSVPVKNEFLFPHWVSGAAMLMRKDLFYSVNGFDEDFWMYYEDVDLCRRIHNRGGDTVICGNVFIGHNHGGSSRVNIRTSVLTKTEVLISQHVYIAKHFKRCDKVTAHAILVISNIIIGLLLSLAGILFFFIPKLFVRLLIFIRLIKYYTSAIRRSTWLSSQSVNYKY